MAVPHMTHSGTATVMGWGATTNQSGTNRLREVNVPLATQSACERSYPGQIYPEMLCAGYTQGGKDSCQGDSGGPLIMANSRVQVGIVSWGDGCGVPGKFGVYANVAVLSDWIQNQINNSKNEPGTTNPPTPPSSEIPSGTYRTSHVRVRGGCNSPL